MFELAVRLLLAGGLVFASGMFGWQPFDAVWITAAAFAGVSLGGYWLEWTHRKNAGYAGLIAGLDAGAIAALLAAFGFIPHFGFLVLAPCAYAAAKYGSLPSAMAPMAAFALLGADQWANRGAPPTPIVFGHAMSVLAIGLLLNHRRIIVSVAKPVLPNGVEPLQTEEPEAYMELRESFRKLKDMYQNLERKSRRDRFAADLRLALAPEGDRFHKRLASQLAKLSNAPGLSLYTMAEHAGGTVLRAVEGSVAEPTRQSVMQFNPQEAIARIREQSENALRSLIEPSDAALVRNVVITHAGRVVGLVAVQGDSADKVDEAAEAIEEIAPIVGEVMMEGVEREIQLNRMRRAELLYELASTESGASSRNGLAARVVRELGAIVDVENLAIGWIDGQELLPAASHGTFPKVFDGMSFAEGPGLVGWMGIGAPEIVARDTAEDARCRRADLSKVRIQSLAIFPIGFGADPVGVLVASSPRSGAIDGTLADALRLASAEVSQCLARLSTEGQRSGGLASAAEIHALIREASDGCLVFLEPLRKEELIKRSGAPAFEIALRQLAHRIRPTLPPNGAVYRRAEGDYVVYLPGIEDSVARSWANQTAALANLIEVPLLENGRKAPLALRAKVARMGAESELEGEPVAA